MAESILKIHTQNGDIPVGYPGLADKPIADKTLSKEGAFADSKAVGDKFKEVKAETNSLKEDLSVITDTETKTETHNIEQNVIKTSNYYYWNGKPNTNTDYFYAHLDNLQEGDIITAIIDSAYQIKMRFVDAYNGTDRVSSASVSKVILVFIPFRQA